MRFAKIVRQQGETKVRIGAVSYLNSKPLVFRMRDVAPAAEVIFDLPSRLADQLADGNLDVALIPSIEYLRHPEYTIVSDAAIACTGPVMSVKLLSRKPMHMIRSVALDEGSRTSGVLVRILLFQRFGLCPDFHSLPVDAEVGDCTADAVLLIGDRAIRPAMDGMVDCWDLGDQWCRWAELPFVFAMWVARPGVDTAAWDAILSEVRDEGVAHLQQIARAEAEAVGLTEPETLRYLRDNLHFYFGLRERRGLHLYYQLAARMGVVAAPTELLLDDCRIT